MLKLLGLLPISIVMKLNIVSHNYRNVLIVLLALGSSYIQAQQANIVTPQNALPKMYQDLLGDLDKTILPEGYEYVLWAPDFIPEEGTVPGYVKVAVPSNVLNPNASTDYKDYAASSVKSTILNLNLYDAEGNNATVKNGSFMLGGSIMISPPTKCYLTVDEFKKDKSIKINSLEGPKAASSFKYIDTLKGELKKQNSIVVGLDKLHCGTDSYRPWIDLIAYEKPIYCAVDFNFKCATVDELSLIDSYKPLSANYLAQKYTNPGGRNLLNEILPDGLDPVAGNKDVGIPIGIFNDLETIEEYANSKESMHSLFNRVLGQSMAQSLISIMAMHEAFDKGVTCGTGRKAALTSYIKGKVAEHYEQISSLVDTLISKYTKIVPCGTYFFEATSVEKNSKEFNAVIDEINAYCRKAFHEYQAATTYFTSSATTSTSTDPLSGLDRGLAGYVNFSQNAPKDIAKLNAEGAKVSDANLTAAKYLLEQLMKTAYFKFFYAGTFSSAVGKFDINKCVQGASKISSLTMEPITSNVSERLTMLQTSAAELVEKASESINDILETKNTIVYSSDVDTEKSNHKERREKLVEYLLSYTLAFKQYQSIMLPSSREFLLSTKLIGEVYSNDATRANWNKAIGIGASIIAVAGGILALTGIGAPVGSLLTSLSAAINSWVVLAATTSIIMVNAGINWDKAVTEEEYAQIAGATSLREDEYNYADLVKALEEQSSALTEGVTNIAFLALPVGAYGVLKSMPTVSKVLGLGKTAIAEEKALIAFDKGSKLYKESGLIDKDFGSFLSAKMEDDALFKSIIGTADDPAQIMKNAAAVKTEAEYNNFIKELNKAINEKGVVDYKQIELATLPTKEAPTVSAVTKTVPSTTVATTTKVAENSLVYDYDDLVFVQDALKLYKEGDIVKLKTIDIFLDELKAACGTKYEIIAASDEFKAIMSKFDEIHKFEPVTEVEQALKIDQIATAKAELKALLEENGINFKTIKEYDDMLNPLVDNYVLGSKSGNWEDGKFVAGRYFIPEKKDAAFYVRPGSIQRYMYNEKTNSMTPLTGSMKNSPYYTPPTKTVIDPNSKIYYKGELYVPTETGAVTYRKVGSGDGTKYFYNPKTKIMESKQDVINKAMYSTAEEKSISKLTQQEKVAYQKESGSGSKTSLDDYFESKELSTIKVETKADGITSTSSVPTAQKITRTNLAKIKADPGQMEKGFKYIISKDGEIYLLDANTTLEAENAFMAKNNITEIIDKGTISSLETKDIKITGTNTKFNAKDYFIKQIEAKDASFFPKTSYSKLTVGTESGKPDVKTYYKGEETTVPIKYERVYREFGESVGDSGTSIITKLFGQYSSRRAYKLSPEILEGAIKTGELTSASRSLKYFIKNDGTIEVCMDTVRHQEILNKYAQSETSIRGYGFIYSDMQTIGGKKVRRLYLSSRGGSSGLDLDKYFDDYLRYMYKEADKELPFFESGGKLYYQPISKKVDLNPMPDVKKYYLKEETTVPIKYEKTYGSFDREQLGHTVIEDLYDQWSTRLPYKLTPEIINGAVKTGELGTNEHNLKYFIKTDGTIEITSDHAHHVETTNLYAGRDINFIRGYGNIYTRDQIINGEKVMRMYLSPRNGASGLDLDKYFDDYLRYLYKDAGKRLPFIEHEGVLYYKKINPNSSEYWYGKEPTEPLTYKRLPTGGVMDNIADPSEYGTYKLISLQKLNTDVIDALANDAKAIKDMANKTHVKEYKLYVNSEGTIKVERTNNPHNFTLSTGEWYSYGNMMMGKAKTIDGKLSSEITISQSTNTGVFNQKKYVIDKMIEQYTSANKTCPIKQVGSEYYYIFE